jgi:predicted helicase
MTPFQKVLQKIREQASDSTELGNAFEKLTKIYLENDAIQTQEYSKIWHYRDWAKENTNYSSTDIGIDLVAKLRGEDGYCAIQCKFYQSDHSISKSDLDSFISASSTPDFKRLVLIDTSTLAIGKNAQSVFDNLRQKYIRIQITELEESQIDWASYLKDETVQDRKKNKPRDHQLEAIEAIKEGLKEDDRGKMIMACGTGKTFTSLKIAEELAGNGKTVLYMVPSLALMSQTIREWKKDSALEFTAFSACSDKKVGKKIASKDEIEISLNDLAFPATTNAEKLAEQINRADKTKMTVVFSTYHSIDVISKSQYNHDLSEFDLIICDEAHRTTGATLSGDDESNFVKIHSNENIQGKKRLYMTATPRIFGETAKKQAEEGEVALASMDDVNTYGKTLFYKGFGWAVENNLLTDYKVVVLMMDERQVSDRVQKQFSDGAELKLDDATKMIGCYKALAKVGMETDAEDTSKKIEPMKRALAFCQTIDSSKMFSSEFAGVVEEYTANEDISEKNKTDLKVELHHVDGTFNAEERNERLRWLKDDLDESTCRVLTNARCLSEGVDVPALDAVMFLHPRKSQIDVVQSVGRVMRKSEGKKLGYVILPITVAPGVSAEKALDDNERYKVVWQILNALRAHDERFDSTINRIGLGEDVSKHIEIIDGTSHPELEATTAVVEGVNTNKKKKPKPEDEDTNIGEDEVLDPDHPNSPVQLEFTLDELSQAIKAKIVDKCGTREYWDKWAKDIAKIAEAHITRITSIIASDGPERDAFKAFLSEIRDDLNPEISEKDAIEMLAQHLITKPVFDTLFRDNQFTSNNPVSKAMEIVLGQLQHHNITNEAKKLQGFYDSVRRQSEGISTAKGRQALVVRLYDQFFRSAFPAMTQKLGIVYTPVEVVDFIIHSVNDVLKSEFGQTLGSKGVHILDPFTGTGTFITRLLQSGLIKPEELEHKYKHEIHANEIVLLAYYIAAINIEAVYHDMAKENAIAKGADEEDMPYEPFDGIVLTDTFQLYEQDKDMIANLLPDNSERRTAQKERDIRVIVGNPPYKGQQKDAGGDAESVSYPNLDEKIRTTYAAYSDATNKNSLYNSFVRALRWASDRLDGKGIASFVTSASYLDSSAGSGIRKVMADDFDKIYIFNLRGDQRTKGEQSRQEGGKIFGSGSREPIAITVAVRLEERSEEVEIFYQDVDDYLTTDEKLRQLVQSKSVQSPQVISSWKRIKPSKTNGWINVGDDTFSSHLSIVSKGNDAAGLFQISSRGIESGRDAWVYNPSRSALVKKVLETIAFYNAQVDFHHEAVDVKSVINTDSKKIKWTSSLIDNVSRKKHAKFDETDILSSDYRPYSPTLLAKSPLLIHRRGKWGQIANDEPVIITSGVGAKGPFSVLLSHRVVDVNILEAGAQCFPLKLYEPANADDGLFATGETGYTERDGISDVGLKHFQGTYTDEKISKEDLFYYIYGLLHSPDYRERFKNNLSKELPRIPTVKTAADFWAFSKAGRSLGHLHINYETVEPYEVNEQMGELGLVHINETPKNLYKVTKMKFGGTRADKDKTILHYNSYITISGIPIEAYDYVVNGKPALEWVMERQCIKTDKASGIVNDANDYANETMGNPAYPLELFKRVITVSLETMKIVNGLPRLDID